MRLTVQQFGDFGPSIRAVRGFWASQIPLVSHDHSVAVNESSGLLYHGISS